MSRLEHIIKIKRKHEKDLLLKENVVGCGIGYKETSGKETSDLSIIVYVNLKTDVISDKNIIPNILDGIKIDVQECLKSTTDSKSISYNMKKSEYCSLNAGICKFECLEEQKKEVIKNWIINKVDIAFNTMISKSLIEEVVNETGLFKEWYEAQKQEDVIFGKTKEMFPGASVGRYHGYIDSVFPKAGDFMKELRKKYESKRDHNKDNYKGSLGFVLPFDIPNIGTVTEIGNPKLGLDISVLGSRGIKYGKIKAIDASLFIDFLPHQGVSEGDPGFGEPIFSPSPLFGGKFPRDVIGYLCAYVPIHFNKKINTCPYIGKKPGFPKTPRKRALFVEQIVTDAKTEKGDSGAVLISNDLELIGVHFAGSGRFSFHNKAKNVELAIKNDLIEM